MGKGRHVAKSEEGRFDDPRSTNGTPRQVNLDSNPNLPPPAPVISDEGVLNLKSLKRAKITELAQMARDFNVDGATNMRKQEMIFAVLQAQAAKNGSILGEGVLEIRPDGATHQQQYSRRDRPNAREAPLTGHSQGLFGRRGPWLVRSARSWRGPRVWDSSPCCW